MRAGAQNCSKLLQRIAVVGASLILGHIAPAWHKQARSALSTLGTMLLKLHDRFPVVVMVAVTEAVLAGQRGKPEWRGVCLRC